MPPLWPPAASITFGNFSAETSHHPLNNFNYSVADPPPPVTSFMESNV